MRYTLLVDESGDAGIKKIRTSSSGGASQYLLLGAALVPASSREKILSELNFNQQLFGKESLHCAELSHNQLVRLSEGVSSQKFLAFGVISFKHTLGSYSDEIGKSYQQFYHKCLQYLLECVGHAAEFYKIAPENIDVRFESGIVNLSALKKYISSCRDNPIKPRAQYLRNIDPFYFASVDKNAEPLIALADLIAHALYRCSETTDRNYGVLEHRYLQCLKRKFFYNPENGSVVDWGLKPIHSLEQLKLPVGTLKFLRSLDARPK